MRYVQPYGSTDVDAPYANGNPAAGISGSIPPAEMVEYPLRELTNVISISNMYPDSGDLEQLTKSVRSQFLNFAVDSGTENALVVNYYLPFEALTIGLPLHVLVATANTGAATILVDGLGPTYILRASGANLASDDLVAGQVACLVYDGAFFQLQNYQGRGVGNISNNYYTADIPYAADTSAVANVLDAHFDPPLVAATAGQLVEVNVANANTGAVTLYANNLPVSSVRAPSRFGMQELTAGQLTVGMVALMCYDGTQWQLLSTPAVNKTPSDDVGIQIVKRDSYQSPNRIVMMDPEEASRLRMIQDGWVDSGAPTMPISHSIEIFRHIYVPVNAGNRIKVQLTGGIGYVATMCPTIIIYLAYRVKPPGGQYGNWIPAESPGEDFPEGVGQKLMANIAVLGFEYNYLNPNGMENRKIERFDRNFVISAHLEVPSGPPEIEFGAFFKPKKPEPLPEFGANLIEHVAHGGIMMQIFEYTT